MVGIYKGGTPISGLNLGSSGVKEVYVGSTKVWPAGDPYDNYIYSLETGGAYITHFIGDDYGESGFENQFWMYEAQGRGPVVSQDNITNDPTVTRNGDPNPWASRFPDQANAGITVRDYPSLKITSNANFRGFNLNWADYAASETAVQFSFIVPEYRTGNNAFGDLIGCQNVNFGAQRSGVTLRTGTTQMFFRGLLNNSQSGVVQLGPTNIGVAGTRHIQGTTSTLAHSLMVNGVYYTSTNGLTWNFAGQPTFNVMIGGITDSFASPTIRRFHRVTHIVGKRITQGEMTNLYNLWVSPSGFVNTSVLPSTQIYTGGLIRQHSSSLGIDPADSSTWPDKPLPNGVQIDDPPQFLQTYWATGVKP